MMEGKGGVRGRAARDEERARRKQASVMWAAMNLRGSASGFLSAVKSPRTRPEKWDLLKETQTSSVCSKVFSTLDGLTDRSLDPGDNDCIL